MKANPPPNDELLEAVKDGISNHTGEFVNPWLVNKGKFTHEQLVEVLEGILSSQRLFKNLTAYVDRQVVLGRIETARTILDKMEWKDYDHVTVEEEIATLQNQLKELE